MVCEEYDRTGKNIQKHKFYTGPLCKKLFTKQTPAFKGIIFKFMPINVFRNKLIFYKLCKLLSRSCWWFFLLLGELRFFFFFLWLLCIDVVWCLTKMTTEWRYCMHVRNHHLGQSLFFWSLCWIGEFCSVHWVASK